MKKIFKILLVVLVIIIIIAVIVFFIAKNKYEKSLNPVNSEENSETIIVQIEEGMSTVQILDLLEENNVIQSAFMFKVYIKLNNVGSFKAGKYEFENGVEGIPEISEKLVNGDILDETVTITFVEGKTIEDYAEVIAEKTNNTAEYVLELVNDEDYIDSLIDEYWFITEEIKDDDIYYALEGYILPDTYTFENEDVSVETIFSYIFNYMDSFLSRIRR